MQQRALLLSIRPQHADKIFDGTKRVELRRVRPKLFPGDIVLVYVSTPVRALAGMFFVESIIESTPNELWKTVEKKAGVSRSQYEDYYTGASTAVGIFVSRTQKLSQPMNLDYIRTRWTDFRPPQSYRYLNDDQLAMLSMQNFVVDRSPTTM